MDDLLPPCDPQPPAVGATGEGPGHLASGSPVADTMRRVHAALRAGAPPSYEALLAFGIPGSR
jgi:hypothetical protein